jgi:uncharacterized protein YdhG (YjbR/CyaY superfamily)
MNLVHPIEEGTVAKTDFKTAEEYIATFPDDVQTVLRTVQQAIHEAVPDAEEVISYQIPAFKSHGWVFYYSAYKQHYSLSCPPPFTVFEAFATELAPYEMSKSAIRFPLDQPVPVELITAMAKHRAAENIEAEARKKRK